MCSVRVYGLAVKTDSIASKMIFLFFNVSMWTMSTIRPNIDFHSIVFTRKFMCLTVQCAWYFFETITTLYAVTQMSSWSDGTPPKEVRARVWWARGALRGRSSGAAPISNRLFSGSAGETWTWVCQWDLLVTSSPAATGGGLAAVRTDNKGTLLNLFLVLNCSKYRNINGTV